MSSAYALYRLPHANHYVMVKGQTQELTSCLELDGLSGFVVAPFETRKDQPIVVIRPEQVEQRPLQPATSESVAYHEGETDRSYYAIDFANFHAQIISGQFSKIVLARQAEEMSSVPIEPIKLFLRACECYPRMFIALVDTPQSGIWLTATPEILLDGIGGNWRTIALAGTMKLEGEQLNGEGETVTWSMKNIQEQRIVATYIAECLELFHADFHEEGPRTVRAANLVHLRSDFTFTLSADESIGNLLQTLHPTPAVCGLPKREAFQFIVQNEHTPRRYYSGFMGPFALYGETHLYVSLRCMNIKENRFLLYAGGGLMKDSTEWQEWQETEAKLETMRKCIATSKT